MAQPKSNDVNKKAFQEARVLIDSFEQKLCSSATKEGPEALWEHNGVPGSDLLQAATDLLKTIPEGFGSMEQPEVQGASGGCCILPFNTPCSGPRVGHGKDPG